MAKVETFEVIGEMTITRVFKSKAWSYTLTDADGAEVGSIWCQHVPLDMWASEGGPGPKFRAPIKGEANAVAWLRTLAA